MRGELCFKAQKRRKVDGSKLEVGFTFFLSMSSSAGRTIPTMARFQQFAVMAVTSGSISVLYVVLDLTSLKRKMCPFFVEKMGVVCVKSIN